MFPQLNFPKVVSPKCSKANLIATDSEGGRQRRENWIGKKLNQIKSNYFLKMTFCQFYKVI